MAEEKKLVTETAFQNFINTFKTRVYNWNNPTGTNETTNVSGSTVYGLKTATDAEIRNLFS